MSIKKIIRKILLNHFYEIRKFPGNDYEPLPVFDVLVSNLMRNKINSGSNAYCTFIQVGANDGVFGDPLRKYITTSKWKGILCEPQYDVFNLLKKNYSEYKDNLIFENIAISSDSENMTMYRLPKSTSKEFEPFTLAVSSTDRKVTARQLKVNPGDLEEFQIASMSLNKLIEKHSFDNLDLLQIDTEGYDWEVLKSIDLLLYSPKIIQIEHGHLSPKQCNSVANYLTENNYIIYWGGHQGDTVAIKKEALQEMLM